MRFLEACGARLSSAGLPPPIRAIIAPMFLPLYRAAERTGRVCVKLGLKIGDKTAAAFSRLRAAPDQPRAVVAGDGRAALPDAAPLIHLTFTRGQIPALVFLVLANVALVVAATLLVERVSREEQVTAPAPIVNDDAQLPTPLSQQQLGTEVAVSIPDLQVVVSPQAVGPTPTAPPNPLSLGGTIFYAYRNLGRTNLWALVLGRAQPVRLTAGPWDDRDPAVSPDGTRLAFASRRNGSWNLYTLDLKTGDVKQVTTGLDFKAHPAWSPDGHWLTFEMYRQDNLDIAIVNAGGGDLIPLTSDPAADYEPAWSPNGREIAWVSMRAGNPDLWLRSLNDPNESSSVQLTDTPNRYESHPAFSPNGQVIVSSDAASPLRLVYALAVDAPQAGAVEVGQGEHPAWSPEGSSLLTVGPQENGQDYLSAAPFGQPSLAQIAYKTTSGHVGGVAWSPIPLPETLPGTMGQAAQVADAPLWTEIISATASPGGDPPYAFAPLPGVTAPDPRLSDRVDEAFTGLRRAIALAAGWDLLATLDNALVMLDAPPPPSQDYNTWLKTGRAFDFTQNAANAGWVVITREDLGFRTYWRVWVRTVAQDGSLGEPLHVPPWNFAARYSGRPEPYDAGGEYYAVMPPGYFVDFTTLAEDYGWTRLPAEQNWITFFLGVLYWRFEHRAGLDWLAAIREVYAAKQAATRTPVPSPTHTPTITNTPTDTGTPTNTATFTPRPTRTPSSTWTPRPTRTPSPTRTLRPTLTPTPSRTPTLTPTPTGTWYTATPTPTLTPTETEVILQP